MIKNEGDAPLRVEDVDPDCACTVADYDRVIPPGGQGEITLTIKPYSVMRDFLKQTKVSSMTRAGRSWCWLKGVCAAHH